MVCYLTPSHSPIAEQKIIAFKFSCSEAGIEQYYLIRHISPYSRRTLNENDLELGPKLYRKLSNQKTSEAKMSSE